MSDAGAEEYPEEAMVEAEALEQEAMTEVQGAAATAMKAAQAAAEAMANLAQAVDRWQEVASTASMKRRDAERQTVSLLNVKIQEMQKQMEERTKRLVKMFFEEEMKKRGSAVQPAPICQTEPVADNQVSSYLQGRPPDDAGTSSGVEQTGPSSADSSPSSVTPPRIHQPPQGNVTPTARTPVLAAQTSFSCLLAAVTNGKLTEVQKLLKEGVDPNIKLDKDNTLLHEAVKSAHSRVLQHLLDFKGTSAAPRMQIDAQNLDKQTPLHVAALSPNGETCVNVLLKYKAVFNKKDANGDIPLHCAVRSGHDKIVERLLTRTQVDYENGAGQTALHVAASSANAGNCVDILLKEKADVKKRDAKGDTALHCAARNGFEQHLEKLLEGTQVDIKNDAGQTALHVAASISEGLKCVNVLLDKKADINMKDDKGDTPLHCATSNGHKEIVMKLIENADLNIKNNKDQTPMDVAKNDEVRSLLQLWADLDRNT